MFYSQCPKCGLSNRWLTKEESEDKELVKKNKHKKVTKEELEAAAAVEDQVKEVHCLACKPNKSDKVVKAKAKKSKVVEE